MTEPAPQPEQGFFPSSIHPGDLTEQLRRCREKAGLDLEQAAEELHLSPHILKALEAEDFAHLPEPPYVRGYLRGYAKLADADSKELIRLYEALRGANPDETAKHFAPVRPLQKVSQPVLSTTTLKFIGFGALVLLLGLLSMLPGVREWASHTWGSFAAQSKPQDSTAARPPSALEAYALQKAEREQEKNRQESLAQQAAATPAPTVPPVQPVSPVTTMPAAPVAETTVAAVSTATPESAPAAQPPATSNAATTTPPAPPATSNAATTTPPAPPATSDLTATPAASTPVTMPTAPASDTNAAATAAPAPAAQPPMAGAAIPAGEQATATPVTIKMEFSEEVWAQIKGIDKKTLYEALNTPNTIKEFQVVPPVDIKLGNAPGVKVFINGQPFDTTPHTKGSVARFKVE